MSITELAIRKSLLWSPGSYQSHATIETEELHTQLETKDFIKKKYATLKKSENGKAELVDFFIGLLTVHCQF